MNGDSTYVFEKEKISRAMVQLAVPSILVSIVDLIYSMINQYFVGMLKNSAMIAAISTVTTIDILIESVGICVGIGGASYLGRTLGARSSSEKIYETVRTSMTLCLSLTVLHMIVGFLMLKPYVLWQTKDAEVISYSMVYGVIDIFMMLFFVIRTTTVHMLRAVGDIKYSTNVISASVLLNIVLDPILMFDWGFGLGIYGAALATAICRMITAVLCLKRLQSRKTPIYWKPFDFHMDKGIVREIMRVGLSCYVRNMLPALSSAIYNKQVFVYSTDFVAGCSIGRNASYFMNFFIQGAANGYMPFASYNYGAGNYKRLYKSIVWSLAVLTGYSLITDAVIWKFAYEYIGLFAANEASIEYGVRYILAYTLSLPIYAAYYILTISLQAAGKGKESMILSVSRQGLIYIPLVMILPIFFRENGIYYTQPLSDWITVILAVILSWHLLKEIYHGSKAAGQLE